MVNRTWVEPTSREIDARCLAACGDDPFIAAILVRRGYTTPQRIRAFLSTNEYSPCPPEQLPDLVTGSTLVCEAVAQGKRILIWGDFDVDGQTSTALLLDGLQRLGAMVDYYIPDRSAESHGIKVASLQKQIDAHTPDLLITCDTGISEYAALDYAQSVGLPVIITDHHDLADRLPPAAAVINPRRLPATHPLTSLPGVGVAFKLMQHVYTSLGRERELPRLLDLVALGIVGDVATQTDDTRYLLQLGLERLRQTERIGPLALMENANLSPAAMTGERIAYQIGPRLNAAGRLADAALAVDLLTTHNSSRARVLAQQLEGLNNERRVQTRLIEAAAEEMITSTPSLLDYSALVLYQPEWHPGITGIVASHLAERYGRPVVMLSGQEGGIARGSARSPQGIDGYDISKALSAQADILRTYGGHPGAAGLSLDVAHIDRLRQRLSKTLADSGVVGETALAIDAVVDFDALTLDLAGRIQKIAPFGPGNPQVLLATTGLHLSHATLIGRDQLHRRLTVEDNQGRQQIVLWWHSARDPLPDGVFDIAYNVTIGERQELQLSLVDYRIREAPAVEVVAPTINLVDCRKANDPLSCLGEITAKSPHALIWAEAFARAEHPTWKRRAELTPCDTLIIYSAPPDPLTLRDVIERVQPMTVYVVGAQPPVSDLSTFLALLAQAASNVIDHLDGKADLGVLCGATAQSPQTVRAALDFLAATGQIGGVAWPNKHTVRISSANGQTSEHPSDTARARFEAAYNEAEAYRRYFRAAPLDCLLSP